MNNVNLFKSVESFLQDRYLLEGLIYFTLHTLVNKDFISKDKNVWII